MSVFSPSSPHEFFSSWLLELMTSKSLSKFQDSVSLFKFSQSYNKKKSPSQTASSSTLVGYQENRSKARKLSRFLTPAES